MVPIGTPHLCGVDGPAGFTPGRTDRFSSIRCRLCSILGVKGEVTSAKFLRDLPSLVGPLPAFYPDTAPAEPDPLFERWLAEAIGAGVVGPHAMTLSTVDPVGRAPARVGGL